MNHNKDFSMDGVGEDIFYLSNGHISPVWSLYLEWVFSSSELSTFRKIDSRLQGHPATHEGAEGIRILEV